jgi:TonB family protein
MRTTFVAILCFGLLASCAHQKPTHNVDLNAFGRGAAPGEMKKKVRHYIAELHNRLHDRWVELLVKCKLWLPPDHPANRPDLKVVLELRLDEDGQPDKLRVYKSSGLKPFDDSAMGVMSTINKLPPLPRAAGEGYGVIRWTFHRDPDQSCSPTHTTISVDPFPPRVAMRRALSRRDWKRAREVLSQHRNDPQVVATLVEAGLRSGDPGVQQLAVRRAAAPRILPIVVDSPTRGLWREGIATLKARGEKETLVTALRELLAVGAKGRKVSAARVLATLDALQRLKVTLPADLLPPLLQSGRDRVIVTTLCLVHDAAALAPLSPLAKQSPRLGVALRARRCALGASKTDDLTAVLDGRDATIALAVIDRCPTHRLARPVAALAKRDGAPSKLRVAAIKALAGIAHRQHRAKKDIKPVVFALYTTLRSSDEQIQLATVNALGRSRFLQTSISYRLTDVTYHGKVTRKTATRAVVNIIRLGVPKFQADVQYLARRLAPAARATVVRELWRYGDAVVPQLIKMYEGSDRTLRRAAAASLARIPTAQARRALAEARRKQARKSKERPPRNPLHGLLLALR